MVARPAKHTFKRSVGFSLLMVFAAYGTWQLGEWQTRRGDEKQATHEQRERALQAEPISPTSGQIDSQAFAWRWVTLKGQFLPESTVMIDNRQVNGRPAVLVVQGFKPEGRDFIVPVGRGLLPRDPANPRALPALPNTEHSSMPAELKALLMPDFPRAAEVWGLSLGKPEQIHAEIVNGQTLWSNYSAPRFAERVSLPLSSFVLSEQPSQPVSAGVTSKEQGFYRVHTVLPEQVAKHRGYAFQWRMITAMLLVLSSWMLWREWRQGQLLQQAQRANETSKTFNNEESPS